MYGINKIIVILSCKLLSGRLQIWHVAALRGISYNIRSAASNPLIPNWSYVIDTRSDAALPKPVSLSLWFFSGDRCTGWYRILHTHTLFLYKFGFFSLIWHNFSPEKAWMFCYQYWLVPLATMARAEAHAHLPDLCLWKHMHATRV